MSRYLSAPDNMLPDEMQDREAGLHPGKSMAKCPNCGTSFEHDPVEESAAAAPMMDEDGNRHMQGASAGDDENYATHAERTIGPHIDHGRGKGHQHGRGFPHRGKKMRY